MSDDADVVTAVRHTLAQLPGDARHKESFWEGWTTKRDVKVSWWKTSESDLG